MIINDYNLKKGAFTYLKIFSIVDGNEVIHREFSDSEAYDRWHLQVYYEEILHCRELISRNLPFPLAAMRRPDRDFFSFCAINALNISNYCELGSSLLEVIDGYELVESVAAAKGLKYERASSQVEWSGIEISELLRKASLDLHKSHSIRLFNSVSELLDDSESVSKEFLYDRSVGNYAFTSSREYADFTNQFRCCVVNNFFSLSDTFNASRLGKVLTYFSLSEFLASTKKEIFHLYGNKAPTGTAGVNSVDRENSLEGYFFIGSSSDLNKVMLKLTDLAPEFLSSRAIEPRRL